MMHQLKRQVSKAMTEEEKATSNSVVCNRNRPLDQIAFLANGSLFLDKVHYSSNIPGSAATSALELTTTEQDPELDELENDGTSTVDIVYEDSTVEHIPAESSILGVLHCANMSTGLELID